MSNLDFNFFCGGCTESIAYRQKNCFPNYRLKRFEQGEYLVNKGDLVRELSMLIRGSIDVSIILESGQPLTTRHWMAPYPMGAVALFSKNNIYRVNVVACEACEVVYVSRFDVEEQMMKCRRFMRNFISHSIEKFDTVVEHINQLSHKSLNAKLAHYILHHADGDEYRFDKRIGELAAYICVERPSLSRAIASMVSEGVITYNKGRGIILDQDRLKSLLG